MTDLQPVVHSDRIEKIVLSMTIADARIYSSIKCKVNSQSFHKEPHRVIWRAIRDICEEDKTLSTLAIIDRLEEKNDLERVGGQKFVVALGGYFGMTVNWQEWVEKLHVLANQRHLCAEIDAMRTKLSDRDVDHVEIAERLKLACDASMDSTTSSDGVSMAEADAEFIERYNQNLAGEGKKPYRTGITVIDQRLGGGFHLGRSVVIAGLPKMGKTKLTTALIAGACQNAIGEQGECPQVDWYTAEMTIYEMQCRMISWAACVPEAWLQRPAQYRQYVEDPKNAAKIEQGRNLIKTFNITWHVGTPKLSDIVMNTRRKIDQMGHNRLFVVVDYLQMIDAGAIGNGAEYQNITTSSKTMAGLVKSLGFGLCWVAQFNRSAAQNMEEIPKISQLRGSGQIEQDADEIMVAHRPYAFEKSEPGYDMSRKKFIYLDLQASRHSQNETEVARANLGVNQFSTWHGPIPEPQTKQWQR